MFLRYAGLLFGKRTAGLKRADTETQRFGSKKRDFFSESRLLNDTILAMIIIITMIVKVIIIFRPQFCKLFDCRASELVPNMCTHEYNEYPRNINHFDAEFQSGEIVQINVTHVKKYRQV